MKLSSVLVPLILIISFGPAGPASAGVQMLTLDPESTTIEFELGATLHTVHGSARLDSGKIQFDLESEAAQGELTVVSASAETGDAKRDKKMHNRVLESAAFPDIVLRPDRVAGQLPTAGTATLMIHGNLELHGGTHEISFPASVMIAGDRVTFDATFEVPYVEWGLEDPSALVLRVAKFVTVTVRGEGRLTDEP